MFPNNSLPPQAAIQSDANMYPPDPSNLCPLPLRCARHPEDQRVSQYCTRGISDEKFLFLYL